MDESSNEVTDIAPSEVLDLRHRRSSNHEPSVDSSDVVPAADDTWSPFDALPDEVLEMVLVSVKAVPARQDGWQKARDVRAVLSLRLVCRRWSFVALSPAVWRRRRCDLLDLPGLLRLVPALHTLRLTDTLAASADDVLRGLAESKCEVHTLVLHFSRRFSVDVCGKLLKVILENRRATLKELHFEARHNFRSIPLTPLLAPLDATELRSLTLNFNSGLYDYRFRHLVTLLRLRISGNFNHRLPTRDRQCVIQTLRSLVLANKHTLLDVDLGPFDGLVHLGQCTRLRSAVVGRDAGLRAPCEHTAI